jgi:hypothetical protein
MVEMSILAKTIYKLIEILIKIPIIFFTEIEYTSQNSYGTTKHPE